MNYSSHTVIVIWPLHVHNQKSSYSKTVLKRVLALLGFGFYLVFLEGGGPVVGWLLSLRVLKK